MGDEKILTDKEMSEIRSEWRMFEYISLSNMQRLIDSHDALTEKVKRLEMEASLYAAKHDDSWIGDR